MTRIEPITTNGAEIRALFAEADRQMALLYPPTRVHPLPVEALLNPDTLLLGAWLGGALAGCGAARVVNVPGDRYGEIKRLFVAAACRRMGLSKAIMQSLEADASSVFVQKRLAA